MKDEDLIRMRHMLKAAETAVEFAKGRARADLDHDKQLTLSLIKCIEIIGEAAGQVTEETRRRVNEVPWRNIINMRNRLIHVYFDVNLDIVWETVAVDLPDLVSMLHRVLLH